MPFKDCSKYDVIGVEIVDGEVVDLSCRHAVIDSGDLDVGTG